MNRLASAAGIDPGVVGRERERGLVDAFVSGLTSGARALVIQGEPGIGKTTLWGVGLDRCRAAGMRLLRTRAAQEEVPLAFGGLFDLLEPSGAAALTDEDDPYAAGRTLLAELRALAAEGPLVLALDDLQWLDPGSAQAIRFAVRRLHEEPVGILATARSGSQDPLDLIATLAPGRLEIVELGPLAMAELREVLGRVVDRLSRPLLRQIHEVSGGNPLYALELARGLHDTHASSSLPMPSSLPAAVTRRLEALAEELAPLLSAAAVAGPVTVERLAAVMETADDASLHVQVNHAERVGLLVVDEGLVVRFTHPVIAAAVYDRMGRLARRTLHARLAELESSPDARARHLALCTAQPDHDVATLLDEAARRADRRGAYETAAELSGHSIALTPADEPDSRRDRALFRIRMLAAMGEVGRALAEADDLIGALPPGPKRAAAYVQQAQLEGDNVEAGELSLRRALEDAGDDEQLRGQVLDQLGWLQGVFRGDLDTGIANARKSYDIAVRIEDPELRLSAAAGWSTMEALRGTPRVDLGDEAIELESQLGRPLLWGGPRVLMAEQLLWSGELGRARELFEAANREAASTHNERWLAYGLYNLAAVECAAGALATADELVRSAMRTARDCEDAHVESWTRLRRAMVSAWSGRADEAREAGRQRLAEAEQRGERPGIARILTVLGTLALSEDDVPQALSQLGEAAAVMEETGYGNPGAIPAVPNAIEALARAGDKTAAGALLDRLADQAAALDNEYADALLGRSRGVVMLAQGSAEAATEVLPESMSTFDRLGYRPDAARAALLLGRAWIRVGRRARASQVLADARARFAEMGAVLWEARAVEELERVAPGRTTGELTATERRIASLIAEGLRNREIAQTLFVSPATVEAHLTRIYRKLGIRSRSELARLVSDRGPDNV
jgi:DNA-binding CsgD family transcriptional regulator